MQKRRKNKNECKFKRNINVERVVGRDKYKFQESKGE